MAELLVILISNAIAWGIIGFCIYGIVKFIQSRGGQK